MLKHMLSYGSNSGVSGGGGNMSMDRSVLMANGASPINMNGGVGLSMHSMNGPKTLAGANGYLDSHAHNASVTSHRYMNHNHSRLNHSHGLNISTLSTSKHSLGGNSSSVSPLGIANIPSVPSVHSTVLSSGMPKIANGGLNLSRSQHDPSATATPSRSRAKYLETSSCNTTGAPSKNDGIREQLTSLGLLCLTSLMVAMLALIFLLKISPVTSSDVRDLMRNEQLTVISPDEYITVYEVTLALCALSLSLNLCCLLVCSVQFLFAVKLVRASPGGERSNIFLQKSSITRVCAIGGFFISIPVFLTGIILYTLIQFHSTPAIVTSALIGLGIVFCGCAMVHNVFIWQKEKTNAVKAITAERIASQRGVSVISSAKLQTLPHATLDLSSVTTTPHELSTLV